VFQPWMCTSCCDRAFWTCQVEPSGSGSWSLRQPDDRPTLSRSTLGGAIRTVEQLSIAALYESDSGMALVHAALVANGDRGVLICGPNGAGKSTLACALWRDGFTLVGDDMVMLDPATLMAQTTPRRVSVRTSSRVLLGDMLWRRIQESPGIELTSEGCVFHPASNAPSAVRLAGCIFLDDSRTLGKPEASVRRLVPAHASLTLLPYTNLARQMDPGTVLDRLTNVAEQVPAYILARQPLEAMAASVRQVLGETIA
jgi:hypothetical protein